MITVFTFNNSKEISFDIILPHPKIILIQYHHKITSGKVEDL